MFAQLRNVEVELNHLCSSGSSQRRTAEHQIAVAQHAACSIQPSSLHPCTFMCGGVLKHKMASRASIFAVPASRHCASCTLLSGLSPEVNASPIATHVSSLWSQLPRHSAPYMCATHRHTDGMSLTTRSTHRVESMHRIGLLHWWRTTRVQARQLDEC